MFELPIYEEFWIQARNIILINDPKDLTDYGKDASDPETWTHKSISVWTSTVTGIQFLEGTDLEEYGKAGDVTFSFVSSNI